jgi:hypothetical protein
LLLKVADTLGKTGLETSFKSTQKGAGPVEGVGFLDDHKLAKVCSASRLVICRSRFDSIGGVIEAAACGTPVLMIPLPVHSLGSHLFYVGRLNEFVSSQSRVHSMWETNTSLYEKLAQMSSSQISGARAQDMACSRCFRRLNSFLIRLQVSSWTLKYR